MRDRAPLGLALVALALLILLLLFLVGRPLATDDLWFHLALGEVYATGTLWPSEDPLLHTAGGRAPVQHEWGFGALVFGLERGLGLQGLRVVHGLAVLGIGVLVWTSFRRESRGALPAVAATVAFGILSWRRLFQLRPDLVSIAAAIALWRLLFAVPGGPSWRRVAAVALGFGLWANLHSLFGAGLALGGAGLLGLGARRALAARLPGSPPAAPGPRPGRVAAALGLGALASLVNPRGIAQHLTFFSSSRDAAIWKVRDEWAPFRPLDPPGEGAAGIDPVSWATADALGLLLVGTAVVAGFGFLRRPSAQRLRLADPLRGALACAAACAIAISLRFLWMGFFVLLFLLHADREGLSGRARAARRLDWALAAACLVLTLGFARLPEWHGFVGEIVREPGGYAASHLSRRYLGPGIRFLQDAGLEGRLFNPYHVGGYAGRQLAPQLRTFIDGRTEHYAPQVMQDYLAIVRSAARLDRRDDTLALLDDYGVDLFLGAGLPDGYYANLYTVELLRDAPGWVLVFRSMDHAIYLRRNARNGINLWRVGAYYRERGIPFDPEAGLRPREVVRAAPAWAIEQGLIEPGFARWEAQASSPDPGLRDRALHQLANTWWLLGEFEAQVEADEAALALRPEAREPRRRLANTFLRQRRVQDAERLARELYESDPDDPRSRGLYEYMLSQRYGWR